MNIIRHGSTQEKREREKNLTGNPEHHVCDHPWDTFASLEVSIFFIFLMRTKDGQGSHSMMETTPHTQPEVILNRIFSSVKLNSE